MFLLHQISQYKSSLTAISCISKNKCFAKTVVRDGFVYVVSLLMCYIIPETHLPHNVHAPLAVMLFIAHEKQGTECWGDGAMKPQKWDYRNNREKSWQCATSRILSGYIITVCDCLATTKYNTRTCCSFSEPKNVVFDCSLCMCTSTTVSIFSLAKPIFVLSMKPTYCKIASVIQDFAVCPLWLYIFKLKKCLYWIFALETFSSSDTQFSGGFEILNFYILTYS